MLLLVGDASLIILSALVSVIVLVELVVLLLVLLPALDVVLFAFDLLMGVLIFHVHLVHVVIEMPVEVIRGRAVFFSFLAVGVMLISVLEASLVTFLALVVVIELSRPALVVVLRAWGKFLVEKVPAFLILKLAGCAIVLTPAGPALVVLLLTDVLPLFFFFSFSSAVASGAVVSSAVASSTVVSSATVSSAIVSSAILCESSHSKDSKSNAELLHRD